MALATVPPSRITIDGREIEYRLRRTQHGKSLRIRVGASGVDVLCPQDRQLRDIEAFIRANLGWVDQQLSRVARIRAARRARPTKSGAIPLRGKLTPVIIEHVPPRERSNRVFVRGGELVIVRGSRSMTPPSASLENWLRREARKTILQELALLSKRLGVAPKRVYIMDQRTKWGGCSSLQNLSFNWRLVMAPEYVLRYLVTHEACHLVVPDHSHKFWLTVQSVCPESERARQWLAANGDRLLMDVAEMVDPRTSAAASSRGQ